MRALCLLLCCLPLLSQCASWRFQQQDCAAHPAPLDPALWPQEMRTVHQLRQSGEQPRQLLMVVRRDTNSLQLQALNPLGMELFQLDWRDNELSSQGLQALREAFDMAILVADFQLVHWPVQHLQKAWLNSPWRVEQHGTLRRLHCAGVAVSEVRYPSKTDTSGSTFLSNHLAGYTLEILNLNPQPKVGAAPP